MAVALALTLLGLGNAPAEAQSALGSKLGMGGANGARYAGYDGMAPVVVKNEILESWNYLYRHITGAEFVLCLEGYQRDDTIFIDNFRLARMENESMTSVRYHPCEGERYVGTAHNHPPTGDGGSLCYRSIPDRRSFAEDQRAIVDVILCGVDTYLWVLKDGTTGGPVDGRARERK
jgi:hypothetical protein